MNRQDKINNLSRKEKIYLKNLEHYLSNYLNCYESIIIEIDLIREEVYNDEYRLEKVKDKKGKEYYKNILRFLKERNIKDDEKDYLFNKLLNLRTTNIVRQAIGNILFCEEVKSIKEYFADWWKQCYKFLGNIDYNYIELLDNIEKDYFEELLNIFRNKNQIAYNVILYCYMNNLKLNTLTEEEATKIVDFVFKRKDIKEDKNIEIANNLIGEQLKLF